MNRNYKKEIETLLNNNGLKLKFNTGNGCDFKTVYHTNNKHKDYKKSTGCSTMHGRNFKDVLSKLNELFNKK